MCVSCEPIRPSRFDTQHVACRPYGTAVQMRVLELMPSVDEMAAWARGGNSVLTGEMNQRHVLLLPLLRWLLSTNRAHVRALDRHEVRSGTTGVRNCGAVALAHMPALLARTRVAPAACCIPQQFSSMHTPFQFVLRTGRLDREQEFQVRV